MAASILIVPLAWLLKSAAYWGIFRWRTISATFLNCLVIAGSPFLLSIFPLPPFLALPASIGLAIYLTLHYTGVDLLPEGLFVPLTVEVIFIGGLWLMQHEGMV